MTQVELFRVGGPHLLFFGVWLPYVTWRYRNIWRHHLDGSVTRVQLYRGQIPHLSRNAVLSLLTVAVLWLHALSMGGRGEIFVLGREVGQPREIWSGLLSFYWPSLTDLAVGCAAYVVMIAVDLVYSRRSFDRDAPHMFSATPRSRQERLGWIGISAAAGVTEEVTWRGVQPELIAQMTGHLWPAIAICAITFGVGHIRQGRPFVIIAALFALIFHAVTLLTGSLYVAIMVHIAVNITVGLRAGTWRREGSP